MTILYVSKAGRFWLTLVVLAVEVALAWLSARAYAILLYGSLEVWELEVFQWVIFLNLAVIGSVLAVHPRYGVAALQARARLIGKRRVVEAWLAVGVVVAYDWGGAAIYTVLGTGNSATLIVVIRVVALCGLALLPFLIGRILLTDTQIEAWAKTIKQAQDIIGRGQMPPA
jgi:hypothetical protein